MPLDIKNDSVVVVIFLLVYCVLPLLAGVVWIKVAGWLGFTPFASSTAQLVARRAAVALSAVGVLVYLGLRLGTSVGYPAVLIGAAPFLMPAFLLIGSILSRVQGASAGSADTTFADSSEQP